MQCSLERQTEMKLKQEIFIMPNEMSFGETNWIWNEKYLLCKMQCPLERQTKMQLKRQIFIMPNAMSFGETNWNEVGTRNIYYAKCNVLWRDELKWSWNKKHLLCQMQYSLKKQTETKFERKNYFCFHKNILFIAATNDLFSRTLQIGRY